MTEARTGRSPLQRWLDEGYETTCALPRRKTPQHELRGSLLEMACADIEHDPQEESTVAEINRLATSDPEAAAEAARPASESDSIIYIESAILY